ncbi:phosphatidate cytidylyltransferase [Paracoccaceae bacterium Fryx2]|nr:phosphatidate cytidylyltransferase [Paracoccaceae bacterium Fryx2]
MTPGVSERWSDLRKRGISAALMVVVGAVEIWLGGPAFAALVILVSALMVWELSVMTARAPGWPAVALAMLAGLCLLAVLAFPSPLLLPLLALPGLAGALTPRRDPALYFAYAGLVMLAGYGLVTLRADIGMAPILWIVLVVVVSDVAGYFVGRRFGGPKFWPRVSPKKTWSGTVAGWVGAMAVGVGFALAGQGGWALVWLSPLVAFAGQMGDIAESWIKRRSGVKDSSGLIPGHGGVMDRFDALIGAVVVVLGLSYLLQPFSGV